jgi:hypothetical protein
VTEPDRRSVGDKYAVCQALVHRLHGLPGYIEHKIDVDPLRQHGRRAQNAAGRS